MGRDKMLKSSVDMYRKSIGKQTNRCTEKEFKNAKTVASQRKVRDTHLMDQNLGFALRLLGGLTVTFGLVYAALIYLIPKD